MALSYNRYTANGVTDTFSVAMAYISTTHIEVRVDDVLQTGVTFPTSSTCLLTSTPTNGQIVEVRRVTPSTVPLVDFTDASTLTESDLDTNKNQLFYMSQEQIDTAEDSLVLAGDDKYNANSKVIKNVADPSAAQDAATKAYADAILVSASAATAADVSTTAANVSLTAADVVSTNADVLLTNADVVSTNADVLLTNADVVSTNADVVSTNADVVTTASSASSAASSAAAAVAAVNGGRSYTDKSTSFSFGVTGDGFQGSYAVTASAALDISLAGSYTPAEGDWVEIKDIADTFGDYTVRLVLDNTEFYDPGGGTFSHVTLDFKTTLSLRGSSYFFVYEAAKWRHL